jgi:methylated-DNA-[protein]-cysteine S-methyltransferase
MGAHADCGKESGMNCVTYDSPIGPLSLVSNGAGLTHLLFDGARAASGIEDKVLAAARCQLDDYFDGKRKGFDLPLDPSGTEFQKRVWMALRDIPFGQTVPYVHIASRIGAPKAMRAVGAANGRNPIAIIVPCHRVIGADGSLTGFGGGLPRKRFLLALEQGQRPLAA